MSFRTKFRALLLLSSSRKHLKRITARLKNTNYQQLIENTTKEDFKLTEVDAIVKSYFWAAHSLGCQCLPRSIGLYHHLKTLGYKVDHKIGVNKQRGKINAHSWVELNNRPLNEHPDLYQRFSVLNSNKSIQKQ